MEILDAGSRILLYLEEEGRGVRLTNNHGAYTLQDMGYDTIDAIKLFGFDVNERVFFTCHSHTANFRI